jgi:integrase
MFRPDFLLNTRLPQKEKKQMYIPSDEDIQKIVNLSKNTNCYIPILLAAFGGMREGEICALTSDDINDNFITINKSMVCDSDGKWHIKAPKTFSSNRQVEMPPFVINALKGKTGKIVVYNPHSLSMAFNKLIKNSGISHFRFHDLRHYYVSSLHALNVPDKYIMAQGGWATNYTMQNVYNHAMENKKSEFSSKISSHFETLIV